MQRAVLLTAFLISVSLFASAQTGMGSQTGAGTGNFGGSDSAWNAPVNEQNVADAAREARQRLAKDHPRVFTNNDIARIRQAAGEPTVAGPGTGLVTNEQTMPASDVTAPNAGSSANNPNGVQNGTPTSDQTGNQTSPPAKMSQNPQRPSPFRSKK